MEKPGFALRLTTDFLKVVHVASKDAEQVVWAQT